MRGWAFPKLLPPLLFLLRLQLDKLLCDTSSVPKSCLEDEVHWPHWLAAVVRSPCPHLCRHLRLPTDGDSPTPRDLLQLFSHELTSRLTQA